MLGAAGALLCFACGLAAGSWMRENRTSHWHMLSAYTEALSSMRMLLEQERLALPDLLEQCAACITSGSGAVQVARRLQYAAERMKTQPFCSVSEAYASACAEVAAPWEKVDEKAAVQMLFRQLGSGTAGMREQAVSACLRRLKPLEETARAEAQRGGRLCMQLGMLLGLMAGIALW